MFRQILSLNNKKAFVLISSSGRVANSSIFSMYQVEIRGIDRLRDQRRKKCLALCSRRQVSENASQLTVICDFWAHYKSHFLFNMVFSFCCVFFFFCRFDHCSSNLCKLCISISLCCKGEVSYKHTLPQSPSYHGWQEL